MSISINNNKFVNCLVKCNKLHVGTGETVKFVIGFYRFVCFVDGEKCSF